MSYPTDINDLQHHLSAWTSKTFPSRTTASIMAHLRSETLEVEKSPDDVTEHADCLMLLMDAASLRGIAFSEVISAAIDKLEVNKRRKWGKPNAEGFVEHLK